MGSSIWNGDWDHLGLPEPYPAAEFPCRASVLRQLEGGHAETKAYPTGPDERAMLGEVELAWGESLRPGNVLLHIIEHEAHHRGELSLALGLLERRGVGA